VDTAGETILQIRERLAALDASGKDYIIDEAGLTSVDSENEIQERTKREN